MIVKELITKLKTLNGETRVLISSDEEWNTLFEGIEINIAEGIQGNPAVIFGLSGTEINQDS